MKRAWISVMIAAALSVGGFAQTAYAQQDAGRGATTKLYRGISNLVTGWMEIPKQIAVTSQNAGPGPGFTWGFAKGIGWAIGRTAVGAYEIVTFPFPIPEGYRPVMQPEYVLSDLPENAQPR